MFKKYISLLLSALILFSALPAIAAQGGETLFFEGFSAYGENQTDIKTLEVRTGIDSRVIKDGKDKVFFSRAFGENADFRVSIPSSSAEKTVMSARLKMTGALTSGKLFAAESGNAKATFISIFEDGTLRLYDGKIIGGMPKNEYRTISVETNWKKKVFSVYIDDKCKARDWPLPNTDMKKQPEKLEFQLDYNDSEESDIYVDYLWVYDGDELPGKKAMPSEKTSDEIFEFTPTESSEVTVNVIEDVEFNGGSAAGVSITYFGGVMTAKIDEDDKTGYMYMFSDEKTGSKSFFDVVNNSLENAGRYVVDVRLKVNELTDGSKIQLLDAKNPDAKWRFGYEILPSGDFNLRDVKKLGSIKFGVWNRISVVYNIYSASADVYLNGELLASHSVPGDFFPTVMRIDAISDEGATLEAMVDYIRIYTGKTLQGDEMFIKGEEPGTEGGKAVSVMDPADKLADALKNKVVFMTNNNTMYIDGKKQSYANDSFKPYIINGTLMMPRNMFSLFSFEEVKFDEASGSIEIGDRAKLKTGEASYTLGGVQKTLNAAPVFENGILYFPLRGVAEQILGKKVDWDNRGFVVISDTGIETRKDYLYLNNVKQWSPIDLIYRYMQFDNPSGAEMVKAVKEHFPNKTHPRVYFTNEDVDYILDKVDRSNEWKRAYTSLIASADNYLGRNFDSWYTAADANKQTAATSYFQPSVLALATAYLLTGDDKYAAKGVEIMKGFASWGSLGYQTSNLTTGHWAMAMGVGFDSFYNYMMSSEQGKADLKYIKESILRMAYADHKQAYAGNGGPRWITLHDNFTGVIGGGMMALILAVCDEEDMQTDSEYLAENILKSLYTSAELYFPTGGYFEGVPYSDYMLGNLLIALEGMFKCCGTDYGIGSAPGFTKAGNFFTYMQTSKGCFNFHDAAKTYKANPVREFLGYRYNDPVQAQMGRRHRQLAQQGYDLRTLYFYDKGITDRGLENVDLSAQPLDVYYEGAEAGSFRDSFDVTNPVFVGFHAGWTNIPHDHLDLGEFVFEANGVIWAEDLGSDNYSLPSYFQRDGYKIYRKRTEGENCVVLNPQKDVDSYYGQKLGVFATLIDFEGNKARGAKAAFDLTPAYERDAEKYVRGYYFGDDRNTLTVQDEIALKGDTELYWFMNTSADIKIIDNTKAVLTKDDQSLTVDVYCSEAGYELCEMPCAPLKTSPTVAGQNENKGFRKLAIHYPNVSGNITISVKLSPDGDYIYSPVEHKAISEWTIPEGEAKKSPVFSGVYADGELLSDFLPGARNYTIELPYGTNKIPQITAASNDGEITVKQAENLGDTAVITLKAEGFRDIICKVAFNVSTDRPINVTDELSTAQPYEGKPENLIRPIMASGLTVPELSNGPDKAIDDDLTTRYAQEGDNAWFEFDLGEAADIKGVAIAYYNGGSRRFKYDLLYSEDGENFKRVFSGMSTGETNDYETLEIPGKVRYIRYVGKGNSDGNAWNSITEFRAFK